MVEFLQATAAIEAEHPLIRAKADELAGDEASAREKVLRLFTFVRDQIPYDLHAP